MINPWPAPFFFATTSLLLAAPLPRSTPEAEGIASEAVEAFIDSADGIDAVHSFMLLRHGKVVAEAWWDPFQPEFRHKLYSLSKSFASTAVGMAVAEGKLGLDDRVPSFFPDDAPEAPSENLKNMRVRDLLRMSTGHDSEDLRQFSFQADGPLTTAFLHLPVRHKPGTHFLYNTPATYLCSAIVQRVTGESTLEYLQPRLFEPLGIEGATWESCPQGISLGGYGLSVRTEDIAKLGQLYLQRGEWEGRRLLPATWVDAATANQTANGSNPQSDWDQGYGYQFWQCRHGAYRADGAFGQFCVVLPAQDAVVAITSGTSDMPAVLNLVWQHLLPAMAPVTLPQNRAAQERLTEKQNALTLPLPSGQASAALLEAQTNKRFVFPENAGGLESLEIHPEENAASVITVVNGERHHLVFGYDRKWTRGETRFGPTLIPRGLPNGTHPIATSGAWPEANTLVVKTWYTRTPYALTLTLRFAARSVAVTPEWNVAFGRRETPTLTGTLADLSDEK